MALEPLEGALTVIERVSEAISSALGPTAHEHLNLDRLFARAELHMRNGLSVEAAEEDILSSVLSGVGKPHNKIKSGNSKEEEAGPPLKKDGTIKKEVIGAKGSNDLDERAQIFPSAPDLTTLTTSGASTSGESSVENGSAAAGTSHAGFETESAADEIPEITVLTPPPRPPAPVIDITDESSYPSSCNSDISVVDEVQSRLDSDSKASSSVDAINLSKKESFSRDTQLALMEFEKTLSDMKSIPGSSAVKCNDEAADGKIITDEEVSFESHSTTSDGNIKYKTVDYACADLKGRAGSSSPSSGTSTPFSTSDQMEKDDNVSGKRQVNGDSDYLDDFVDGEDPLDKLWKDAADVCSLLPYFQLADVHQSLVDNFYHPDRKAHVLAAYIQLAHDRGEIIPGKVFLSLDAARKRSHEEACGSQAVSGKKMKIEHSSKVKEDEEREPIPSTSSSLEAFEAFPPVSSGNGTKVFSFTTGNRVQSQPSSSYQDIKAGEPLPSTSGIVPPGSVITSGPDMHATFVVNTGVNRNGSERDKWCKEKIDFISAVISDIDKDTLLARVQACFSDDDVAALLTSLMEEDSRPFQGALDPSVSDKQSVAISKNRSNPSAFQAVNQSATVNVQHSDGGITEDDGAVPGGSSEGEEIPAADIEDRIMTHIATLSEMFNDADPDYLRERCIGINGKQKEFEAIVEELMETKNYPKMEEYLKRQKRLEIKKKFIEGMSVEEFLEYFEDPEKVFCDTEKKMSPTYMENARTQLLRDLPHHLSKDVDNELRKNNYHYLPTLRALEANKKLGRRKTKRAAPMKESEVDDIFIKELCYARMQVEIKEYLLKQEENKRRAFLWAKATHQLQECGCCCDDEILEEDMETCSAEGSTHKFCYNCIRRFAEEEIGQGRFTFRCLEGECKAEFSLSLLKKVMKPSVFSNILQRKQLEEIAAAGIEDLEACPFCNFQTIMPNQDDKVFKCLNPECMKDSCRWCKEPNHVPLRCEEVEKQHQKDARTFLENKMTEAMVRECWKCKQRFIKLDGCNKMRCSCGAMMCYICKKAIKGYDHFEDKPVPSNPNKCPLWSNSDKIHAEEVRDAAKKLKEELDPGIELKHDPTKDLPEVPQHLDRPGPVLPAQIANNPPPAHQRRNPYHAAVLLEDIIYPLYHPPPAHHHYAALDRAPEARHRLPPPQPAHQQAQEHLQIVVNPIRNAIVVLNGRNVGHPERNGRVVINGVVNQEGNNHHHHHHHHHHYHRVHQPAAPRQNAHGPGLRGIDDFIEQYNEFNEILQNVQRNQEQQNQQMALQQNQMHLQQQAQPLLPQLPHQNRLNLPQEQAHDHFIP